MILLLLPALASWLAIYVIRARWVRWVVLALSPLPIYWMGQLYHLISPDPIPPRLVFAYAMLIFIVGVPLAIAPPRRRSHECHRCGYDLRGNPGADQCPECGLTTPWAQERIDAQNRSARREAIRAHLDAIDEARARRTAATEPPGRARTVTEHEPRPTYRVAGSRTRRV